MSSKGRAKIAQALGASLDATASGTLTATVAVSGTATASVSELCPAATAGTGGCTRWLGFFCTGWGRGNESTCVQGYVSRSAGMYQLCEWHPELLDVWSKCREGPQFSCSELPPSSPMNTGLMPRRCIAGYCDRQSALPPKQPLPHFLLVANNPAIAAAQWHWLSAAWTVVRFNDCKVDWPPATDAVMEVLFLRDAGGGDYQGKTADGGLACEQKLQRDFAGHVLHISGARCPTCPWLTCLISSHLSARARPWPWR